EFSSTRSSVSAMSRYLGLELRTVLGLGRRATPSFQKKEGCDGCSGDDQRNRGHPGVGTLETEHIRVDVKLHLGQRRIPGSIERSDAYDMIPIPDAKFLRGRRPDRLEGTSVDAQLVAEDARAL